MVRHGGTWALDLSARPRGFFFFEGELVLAVRISRYEWHESSPPLETSSLPLVAAVFITREGAESSHVHYTFITREGAESLHVRVLSHQAVVV